jgi:hypothetical protein|tara:strand:- start:249 stop:371 length:123 start_codon:yes stop_codon:yes gene_type:complete
VEQRAEPEAEQQVSDYVTPFEELTPASRKVKPILKPVPIL